MPCVIGCGRVGSAVAKGLAADGWDVTVVDENEDALGRLGAGWRGGFVVGHGMDVTVLERAGLDDADAAVVATNGDNTNIVIGQVLQRRYDVDTRRRAHPRPRPGEALLRPRDEHRLPDPDRDLRSPRHRARARHAEGDARPMYVIVAGGARWART